MADQTLMDFFAGQRMTLLAQAATVKSGVPRILPPAFYAPGATRPFNDKVQWPAVTWGRGGATVIARGSPPRVINQGATDWRFATILNMAEEMAIDFEFMQALASDWAPVKENALMELNRRMLMFNQRFETTRTNMVHSLFANGKVWVGSDGQILGSSSGAAITMDPSVATGNQLTYNGSGSTYNIGDWSAAGTDIQSKLRALQETNVQTNGYILNTIIYGSNIPSYLAQNTTIAAYAARDGTFRTALLYNGKEPAGFINNEIPQGFLGFNWIPGRMAYSVKQSDQNDTGGTVTQTFAAKSLTIIPEVESGWYEAVEGGTQVPNGVAGATQIVPNATMQQLSAMFSVAYGKYSYGVAKSYPTVGQSMVQGDVFGPVLKVPGTFYYGTCAA